MTILQECTWCGGRIEARMSRIPVDVGQYSVVLTTPVEACTQCTEWYVSAEVMRDIDWRAARVVLSPERARECGAEVADFLVADLAPKYDVVITNPPFSVWQQVVERALVLAPQVVMLLRIDVLGSAKRAPCWQAHPADVFVLPSRPSFTGDGATDANNYAWFRWLRGALPPASQRWLAVR